MIEQIINWFMVYGKMILDVIAYLVLAASIIVKLTPTPNDDTVLAKIIEVLKKLALYKEQ
jgi:hypothetical protein